jgi:hypothetical protein
LLAAPEILNDIGLQEAQAGAAAVGHGKSVDLWCFGILIFILLTQDVCAQAKARVIRY